MNSFGDLIARAHGVANMSVCNFIEIFVNIVLIILKTDSGVFTTPGGLLFD